MGSVFGGSDGLGLGVRGGFSCLGGGTQLPTLTRPAGGGGVYYPRNMHQGDTVA